MASVLLCQDERLGRHVAVKRLHSDSPEEVEARFVREARLGAFLNHPNLVSVFDTATDDDGVLIVMEYVDGRPLSRELRHGPLTPERVTRMACELGAALDHVHAHGVVHRDVKPGNVLLRRDGLTKLADLGIATAADSTRITRSGVLLGTASYMAPEQLDGREAGRPADVYSLAVVCFQALCGERPHPGRTPMEIAHAIATQPAPDLSERWPAAPAGAVAALKRGMAREPRDRPDSAGELATELARALEQPATSPTRRFARTGPSAPSPTRTTPTPPARPRSTAPARPRSTAPPRPLSTPPPRPLSTPPPPPRDPAPDATARRRPRLPAIGVLGAIIAVAVAVAIAALASGGDDGDNPTSARSDAGAQQRPAERESGKQDKQAEKKQRKQKSEQPSAAAPAAPAPAAPAEPEQPAAEATTYDPARGAALNNQGFELMAQARYDEAIPILQQAVDSFPPGTDDINYAYALFNLGSSLRKAGRPEEAIPILEQRLQIPDQTDVVQQELDLARQAAAS